MEQRLIYCLKCPVTDNVHYIGKSTQGLIRPLSHLQKSHSNKIQEWVAELKVLGYKPKIEIIRYVDKNEDIDYVEKYYISKFIKNGSYLLNQVSIVPNTIIPNLNEELRPININDTGKIFGKFLSVKRKEAGLTQEEFAERAGVALTVIRKIEQGKTNLNLEKVIQCFSMFNTILIPQSIK